MYRKLLNIRISCPVSCEWTSYKDWVNESIDIRQIQVEVHGTKDRPKNVRLQDFFQEFFDQGFIPFFKEANTHPAVGVPGTLFEFAFLRLSKSFFGKH